MPRKSGNEVRGEFLTLQLFTKVGASVTPSEINKHVGRGDYAAKYISFLRSRHGFTFGTVKDGRTIVSYVLESEPKNAAEVRAKATEVKQPKVKAAKPAKTTAKPKASKPAGKPVMSKAEIKKAAAAIQKMRKPKDEVEATFGSSGVIASSFSVDPDWDSAEGLDVRSLVA
jgi:hypothetical protein